MKKKADLDTFVDCLSRMNARQLERAVMLIFIIQLKYTLRHPTPENVALLFEAAALVFPWKRVLLYSMAVIAAGLWFFTLYRLGH